MFTLYSERTSQSNINPVGIPQIELGEITALQQHSVAIHGRYKDAMSFRLPAKVRQHLHQTARQSPVTSSIQAMPEPVPTGSCVARSARNGACYVRGGGKGLIPLLRRNPFALSHDKKNCANTKRPRGGNDPVCLFAWKSSASLDRGGAGKPRNLCLAGGLRNRTSQGVPRCDGSSDPDVSADLIVTHGSAWRA